MRVKGPAFLLFLLALSGGAFAQTGRVEQTLSGNNWNLWLDRGALWYNDDVYLPPVDVSKLPVNRPTCGWEHLDSVQHLAVHVPGTVEEHYWGEIGGVVQDTGGNYIGVSWWSRKFNVDESLKGKRISLFFQSVNLRAEVFVNGKLVGYDVVGNTPFEVDAGSAILFGKENRLDVRITDPVGNFEWDDNILMRWGKNLVPAVHGFGGITGEVILRATDSVAIEDVYVQNQPDPKKVKIAVAINNFAKTPENGQLEVSINEVGHPANLVWKKIIRVSTSKSSQTVWLSATVPQAKLWELSAGKSNKQANVYETKVVFVSADHTISDAKTQRFGFRWFNVGTKDGDQRFYLNGKRVFIMAAMTRGCWPKNGMFPTPEMAKRDMNTLVDLGLNMMLMHRAIGQPQVMQYADSAGLLTYEEPGGYRIMPNKKDNITAPDGQARQWRKEKLRRMVLRDRSLPSMIIYNLKNEETIAPDEFDKSDMQMVHELDPSRILTYNSGSDIGQDYHKIIPQNPLKLHMLPFNKSLLYDGWWDQHHWFAYSGYVDENYRNPNNYLRGVINGPRAPMPEDSLFRLNKKEIIFFGEEGAFGTMVRLQKIKEELDTTTSTGFREQEHLDWYRYYDHFLDETGFRTSYPDVDSLTRSLGRNLHYFQARNIENIRMGNIGDAYNMNGWASESTRTDVVDMYRHPTADASILHHYTQPLYIAVKLRNKVVPTGVSPIADFYIINEENLKGNHTLHITFNNAQGKELLARTLSVLITGGEEFGQLLAENIQLPALENAGYYMVKAFLDDGQRVSGFDEVYAVDENSKPSTKTCSVVENDSVVSRYLRSKGIRAARFDASSDDQVVVIGHLDSLDTRTVNELMQKAAGGAKLIVLEHGDQFARALSDALRTRPYVYTGDGIVDWGGSGRLFVGRSVLLEGLPQAQGMSWEYQCFYKARDHNGTNGEVSGLRMSNWKSELVVALGNQGRKEILTALVRVPIGQGSVILSTLNILTNLETNELSAVVAKRLFLNMIN